MLTIKASEIMKKFASPALAAAGAYAIDKIAKKKNNSPLKSLIPGAAGGVIGTVATAPLDRIKDTMTQFGNQAAHARGLGHLEEAAKLEASSKNLLSAGKHILKSQGLKGFYKGLSGSLVKMPIAMGLTFAASDYLKRKMENK